VAPGREPARGPVGYAAACVGPGNGWQAPLTVGQITDCYVAAPRRRRGIARRLAGRLRETLYERGVARVRLTVAVRNPDSIAFWRAMGWEPLEVVLERPVG
jgi:GNAT superfamily N-acetyltransferase